VNSLVELSPLPLFVIQPVLCGTLNEQVTKRLVVSMVSRPRHNFTRKPNLADVKAAGHNMLRLVNRRILLNILSDRQPISRAEIAKISGLNKARSPLLRVSSSKTLASSKKVPDGRLRSVVSHQHRFDSTAIGLDSSGLILELMKRF
jgi:predicted Mrr-cat superfamily restriction endonuclease